MNSFNNSELVKQTTTQLMTPFMSNIVQKMNSADMNQAKEELAAKMDTLVSDMIEAWKNFDKESLINEMIESYQKKELISQSAKAKVVNIIETNPELDNMGIFGKLKTFDEKVEYFKIIDITNDDQPDGLLSWIVEDIDTPEKADTIADIFKSNAGSILVCKETSFCSSTVMTILDCLDCEEDPYHDSIGYYLLRSSLQNYGVKRAAECDQRVLMNLYIDSIYDSFRDGILDYDYDFIKNDFTDLKHELIEYLYQPKLIEKWIEAGNDIEDYLL